MLYCVIYITIANLKYKLLELKYTDRKYYVIIFNSKCSEKILVFN